MIAVSSVNDTIRGTGLGLQQCRILERADHRLDAARRHRDGLAVIANETANPMTIRNQSRSDRAADKAVGAGKEDPHR